MAKISGEAKKRYFERVKIYKKEIEKIIAREKNLLQLIEKGQNGEEYKKITLADESLNLASYFLLLNRISLSLLGVKNDAFLNDARKSCYKCVIYLEQVVTNLTDVPFSDYREALEKIEGFEDEKRYELTKKLGFTIQSVEDGFGENSKWRWSFVELEGRFATVVKNLINLKTVVAGLDPRVDGYQARIGHLNICKMLLQQAADRYREKYELSTLRIDDFKKAIGYLSALKRLHTSLGEANDAEIIKKKLDVWKSKMDADEKKAEERNKRSSLTASNSNKKSDS